MTEKQFWNTVGSAIYDLPSLPDGGGEHAELDAHVTTMNRSRTVEKMRCVPQGGNWEDIDSDLQTKAMERGQAHSHIYRRLDENEPAPTIANFRKAMLTHPTEDRLLSVREACRLQTVPDWFEFPSDSLSSNQQLVANAVPPRLAEAVVGELS